jgi:2-desacetyl-2-hydroxyethyl bacteriochlorophyllide A dehydrogenase
MKAIYYPAWDELDFRDVPEPSPEPGEVVVRIAAVGICGSELHGFVTHAARRTPPAIFGHEFCGQVAELGPGVTGYQQGDWVGVNSVIACGQCEDCLDANVHLCRDGEVFGMKRPGGFAEYCAVPVSTLLPLPGTVSPLQGALLEPLANGIHALSLTSQRFPETVVIFGAGTIGLFALQVAKTSGALRLMSVDASDARLDVALQLGAERVFNPRKQDVVAAVQQMTRGRGADVVVDAVGAAETRDAAVKMARRGGEVVWLGLHDDPTQLSGLDVVLGERKVLGSFAVTHHNLRTAIGLFAHGKIALDPWVRTFPLAEGVQVFRQLVTDPPKDYIKVVLLP